MPCSPLASWLGPLPSPAAHPIHPREHQWEPALSQLRTLPRAELERLLRSWLTRLGLSPHHPIAGPDSSVTYHALLEHAPVPLSLRVRLYRRKSRLQTHHVEAFAGHLLRAGVSAGILVTTSDFTREAQVIADAYRSPRLRLYTGPQWAAELAARHLGVKRGQLWRWILELHGKTEVDESTPGGAR